MSSSKILFTIVILLSTLIISCSSDSTVDPAEDTVPAGNFSLLTPDHESNYASTNLTFSWEKADNENSEITYELRLGKNNPPTTVIASDIEGTDYTLEQALEPGAIYYWYIVATSESGEKTKSKELFSFRFIEGSGVIANDDLGMPLRYGHSLEFFDDRLWIFAGQSGGHEAGDIWYSKDAMEWTNAVESSDFTPQFHP